MNTTRTSTVRTRLAAMAVACAIVATPVALSDSASAATMPRTGTSTGTSAGAHLPMLASKSLCKKVAAALANPNNSDATTGVYVNFLVRNCKAKWW